MKSVPQWAKRGRSGWWYYGQERPPFAVEPRAGQESVWDYPRPPRLENDGREVVVKVGTDVIARSNNAVRILETASPPTFYLPPKDVRQGLLSRAAGASLCEWKGKAIYWDVVLPSQRFDVVGWSYPDPFPEYEAIRDYVSFYPSRLECYVASQRVTPQPGGFYGGWVTPEIVGPIKGVPGSEGW